MVIGAVGSVSADYFSLATKRAGQAKLGQADPTRGASAQAGPEVQREVQRLKQIDQKVRAHEQAHLSAAGGLATGGASLQTVRGPDGRQYAVSGEVQISVSAAATPEQTIAKAQRIRAAALAPADPSSQDRAVAAGASQLEAQARAALSQQKRDETSVAMATGLEQQRVSGRDAGQKAIDAYTRSIIEPRSATTDIYV